MSGVIFDMDPRLTDSRYWVARQKFLENFGYLYAAELEGYAISDDICMGIHGMWLDFKDWIREKVRKIGRR